MPGVAPPRDGLRPLLRSTVAKAAGVPDPNFSRTGPDSSEAAPRHHALGMSRPRRSAAGYGRADRSALGPDAGDCRPGGQRAGVGPAGIAPGARGVYRLLPARPAGRVSGCGYVGSKILESAPRIIAAARSPTGDTLAGWRCRACVAGVWDERRAGCPGPDRGGYRRFRGRP